MKENHEDVRYAVRDEEGKFLPPFLVDPIALTEQTRERVCKTSEGMPLWKYTRFYAVGVYGGIATAYSVGLATSTINLDEVGH